MEHSLHITRLKVTFLSLFISIALLGLSQDTLETTGQTTFNKKRFTLVTSSEVVLATGSLITLNKFWYKDYPRSSFHLFNDTKEWRGMDKAGHFITSYYLGRTGVSLFRWTGMKDKKAIWYGGVIGLGYLSVIEIMDGYSSQWGFSGTDFLANALGSASLIGQELAWKEQRISFKFSVRLTNYAQYRPNLLGMTNQERILKDYNGQTYWLSVNIASFLNEDTRFPQWLNLAVGYGAEGMTGGHNNPEYIDQSGNSLTFNRYSQYLVSLDVDLTKIKTKSTLLKTLFGTVGFLKFPLPAIEFSEKGTRGYWLGF